VRESARGHLTITSNIINTSVAGSSETYRLSGSAGGRKLYRSQIELLLENLTDRKIDEAIVAGRIKKAEDEARKKRTETLFE
jgi:hypothetical protein